MTTPNPNPTPEADPIDYGQLMQAGAETHLEALEEAEEDNCGCTTCLVHEVLTGAWPAIRAYAEAHGAKLPPDDVTPADS